MTARRVVVAPRGTAMVSAEGGLLTIRADAEGSIEVDFDEGGQSVLLRITEAIELQDGDMISAGDLWLWFEAGHDGRPGRLHRLDAGGEVLLTFTLRGQAMSFGRGAGDVIFPQDDQLSELHFQLLVRDGATFVQDLASAGGTYVVVRAGEALPSNSTLVVGHTMIRVSTPPPATAEPGVTKGSWRTGVYDAA